MSAQTELAVVPPQETALAVFSTERGMEPWLQQIRTEIDGFTPDTSSQKGRDAIASMAYKVARSKTALDDVGKKLVADLKEIPKKIDAERKRVRDTLESWQKEVRKPLDDWQAEEDKRVQSHEDAIHHIKLNAAELEGITAEDLADRISKVEAITLGAQWEEFEAEAARAKDSALATLRATLVIRQKTEADLAAIAKFNAEQAIREQQERDAEIARAAVEQAQREADAKALAERQAAAAREQALIDQAAAQQRAAEQAARDAEAAAANQALQLKLQAEQAERAAAQAKADQLAAEQRAAQQKIDDEQRAEQQRIDAEKRQAQAVDQAKQAEIKRQADAKAEEDRLAKAREADKAHKGAIYKAAKEAFITNGMSEQCARLAVKVIASGLIPAISIQY